LPGFPKEDHAFGAFVSVFAKHEGLDA
jgi:hypothetical protein